MIKLKKKESTEGGTPVESYKERVRFEPGLASTAPHTLASKTPGHLRFGHIACYCRAKPCINQSLPLQHVAPLSALAKEEDATTTSVSIQSVLKEQAELLCSELQGCLAQVGSFLAHA
jgi:hypothetical protein